MADNIKQDFQYFDIPDGQGGYERKWCKDAEARAAIAQLDPASAASEATCEDIIDDIVDGTTKTQGHETEVIPVSGLKAALDKYKNDVTDEGLSGKQDTISDLATIRSGAQAGATAYQKPNGGIPKTDLASAVQTSLGRADTALQEHQDITGKVDKTTTVNGHALSGNVSVTKSDVGLGNVTNDSQVKRSEMGAASGVATLDSTGKVPSSQLPSYVDDVLEYETKSVFPTTGEGGKIYVDKSTDTTWRWSGTTYTQIKGDLVIGTTTGTAADGGTASAHYSNTSNPHGVTKSQVGLGSVVNTGDSATPVSGGTTKFTTGGAYTELAKKVDKVSGKGLSTNDYTTDEKNKLAGIASGAEVNQNAFSNVVVGSTTISADGKTDSITLVAGSNVTLTPDATNDKITIAATDTTYSAATTSAAGLMSSDDKTKLNGIASGATNVTTSTVAGWGYTKNAGTVTQVKVGSTAYDPSSGVVSLPAYPTSLPASDVYSWAKASSKPSYTASEVGLGNVGNFKAVSTVASQGLSSTEQSNARANIGAGTSSFSGSYNDLSNKPTIPSAANNGTYTVKTLVGSTTTNVSDFTANQSSADDVTFVQGSNVTITPDATNRKITIAATDTTYSSKTAASGGTDISLCTTGEKYTWNDKQSKVGKLGSTSKPVYTSAAGTFAECSTYAGGTAVTLNGAGKGGSTASFYAPTSVGTSGQVLVSSGSGAPSWASVASVATCEAIVSELT